MVRIHMDHVWAHIERLRLGQITTGEPGAVFLGAEEGDSFQELIAFRMPGIAGVGLAIFEFKSHGLRGVAYARESLASYLNSPPVPPSSGPFMAPTGSIAVLLPRADEPIPQLLKALRSGRPAPSLVIDPPRIQFAFDFRGHNPSSREVVKRAAGPLRAFVIRTLDGHVLTGRSASIGARANDRFVALTEVIQVSPRGTLRLPDLVVNTSWIAMSADVTKEGLRIATGYWPPFLAAQASPDMVIGPFPSPAAKGKPAASPVTPAVGQPPRS